MQVIHNVLCIQIILPLPAKFEDRFTVIYLKFEPL